jgi:hypothetical protein
LNYTVNSYIRQTDGARGERQEPVPRSQYPVKGAVPLNAVIFTAEAAACRGVAESEDGRDAEEN